MTEAQQMELETQDGDEYVSLSRAMAENRCWYCGAELNEPYSPVYHSPGSLPEEMPTCVSCAQAQDVTLQAENDESDS
jgi:hypothetical protein